MNEMHILQVVQSQVISPGHMYRSSMLNGLSRWYLCMYACIYVTVMIKEENMNMDGGI